MIYIGILGFGVVGSGVTEVISMNSEKIKTHLGQPLKVKKILDVRKFPESEFADLLTSDVDGFFSDNDISLIVETVGGVGIAYEFTKRALSQGKTVVTSNKELVATHGVELMSIANQNNCAYLFEAAVGGGIPIIRPLHRCLAANRIMKITGIVNGTTNYILTQMSLSKTDFKSALTRAQEKGYAEQNPAADIDGIDAQRKISILASIAMNGAYVDPNKIHTEGISAIDATDIAYAKLLKSKIKLLAIFSNPNDTLAEMIVAPHIVDEELPLCVANGVFNAIMVKGNALGDAMFYGKGAGRLATASAVVGDVLDGALHKGKNAHITQWYYPEAEILFPFEEMKVKALIRVQKTTDENKIRELFPQIDVEPVDSVAKNETAFVVGKNGNLTEKDLAEAIKKIPGFISRIRVY
jgi:homoserine dehydrogenase